MSYPDVSTSFKRLQAEKLAADRVLRELTSVESVTEVDALRDFLQNLTLKNEVGGFYLGTELHTHGAIDGTGRNPKAERQAH